MAKSRMLKRPLPPAKKVRPVERVTRPVGQASGLNHHEVYVMYRQLGAGRSLRRLMEAVTLRWPANPVATGTLGNWAAAEGWKERIEEYELGLSEGALAAPAPATAMVVDDVGVLEQAASQALAAALRATSVAVRSPSDVKALVETANKALELADRLKQQKAGVATSQEIAEFGAQLLQDIETARRKDFIAVAKTAAESACAEAGTTNLVQVLKKTAGSLGMRVDDKGVFYDLELPEVDEAKVAEAEVEDAELARSNVEIYEAYDLVHSNAETEDTALDLEDVFRQLRGD